MRGHAGVHDFDESTLSNTAIRDWCRRVEMVYDPEIDAAYPQRSLGKVGVEITSGQQLFVSVDIPKGDPDNTLSRLELDDKMMRLAAFRQAADLIRQAWQLRYTPAITSLFPVREVSMHMISKG